MKRKEIRALKKAEKEPVKALKERLNKMKDPRDIRYISPGNKESAGKRKSTSVTKGNPYVKTMLCEIAWVIAGKRNSYLSAWYWRIKQKKGAKKVIIALARKLLVIIYTMLKQGNSI